jgi:GMP synthase (glutamine-hydrolysing)
VKGQRHVLFVQHQPDCPPGYLGERAEQRGFGVDVVDAHVSELPDSRAYDLIVPLGSDDSAYDDSVPYLSPELRLINQAISVDVPIFGICFGAQLLSRALGGHVRRLNEPEIGWMEIQTDARNLVDPGPWLVWHLDAMTTPPRGTEVAKTNRATQAFVHGRHAGVQFHPEATPWSAEIWTRHYQRSLAEIGIDPDSLLKETTTRETTSRRKAYELFDRIVDRAAIRTSKPE